MLLGLVLALRRSESASSRDLPFRWRAAGEPIRFETYDRKTGRTDPALLRPDAILELGAPGRRRRLFLELESGLAGLEPGERRTAHVERRIDRTAAVFKRYNIVEEQDLKAAVQVLNRARASTPPGAAGAGLRSARAGDGETAPATPGGDGRDSVTVGEE